MRSITTQSILAQIKKSSTVPISPRINSPEPIDVTASGVARGRALYDTPPPGSEPEDLPRSARKRAPTQRATAGYLQESSASKQRSERNRRTRARNRSNPSCSTSNPDPEAAGSMAPNPETEVDNGGRAPSKSPTPIPTANEPEGQPPREQVQELLKHKFNKIVESSATQMLIEIQGALSEDPAYASQSQVPEVETRFLVPTPVGVGGGFHLDHPVHRPGNNTKTYQSSRNMRKCPHPSPSEIELSSDGGTDLDDPPIHSNPPQQSAQRIPTINSLGLMSSGPLELSSKTSSFLGYPSHSLEPISPSLNVASRQVYPTTSSQSLGDPIPPWPCPPAATSSQSLGDPIPMRGVQSITPSRRAPTPAPAPAPVPTSTPAPMPATSTGMVSTQRRIGIGARPAGVLAYGTRLNIIKINSQRVTPQTRHSGPVRRRRRQSRKLDPPSIGRNVSHTPHAQSTSQSQPNQQEDRASSVAREVSGDELDLLEDFNEDVHAVEAATQGVQVKSSRCKPTARDLHGTDYALWISVRDVTWAFSMSQGNFQTRTVYETWVENIYVKLYRQQYPAHAFQLMSNELRTVILNGLSNCRFKDKERLRAPVKAFFGFKDPVNEEERLENKSRFGVLHPHAFHYSDKADPYEGEILPHTLTAMFFHGPNAIGAKYPGLFEKTNEPEDKFIHIPITAYLATMVQFCLEEWREGYFQKLHLNVNYLLDVYICHYDGLKVVDCMHKQFGNKYIRWFQDSLAASKATTVFKKRYIQPVICAADVRTDTPSRSPSPNHISCAAQTTPRPTDSLPARILVDCASGHSPLMPPPACMPSLEHLPSETVTRIPSPMSIVTSPPYSVPPPGALSIIPFASVPHADRPFCLSPTLRGSPTLHDSPTPAPETDAEAISLAKGKGCAD